MLGPSLGAAWFAWQIGPPVGFCAEPRPLPGRQISVPRRPQTAHAAARSIRDKRAPTGSLTRQRNRDSSSCSQQPGLYRRPPRPERQLALILLRRCTLQARQYLRNELRLLDAGDDLQLATAARAALDLYTEHSLQPSCPAHRHMPGRRRLDRISPRHRRRRCTPAPLHRSRTPWPLSMHCLPLKVSTSQRLDLSGLACGNFASRSSSKEMPCWMHGLPLRRSTSVSTWSVLIVTSGS